MNTFQSTIQERIETSPIPVLLDPKAVFLELYTVEELDQHQSEIDQCVQSIRRLNEEYMDNIEAVAQEMLRLFQKERQFKRKDLMERVLKFQEQFRNADKYSKSTTLLVDILYQMVGQLVGDISTKPLVCEEFHQYLTDIIERIMCRLSKELPDFAKIESRKLYMGLKTIYHTVILNVNLYVHRASVHSNSEMEALNELFVQNSSLANLRSYEILQVETSFKIIHLIHLSLGDLFFFRPEFLEIEDLFVKQTIRIFYEYSHLNYGHYHLSTLTQTFEGSLKLYDCLMDDSVDLNEQLSESKLQDISNVKYKEWVQQKKKIYSEQMLTKGSFSGALVGGSIGAGIGCLIVDSTDPKLPWKEKLRRAGFSTFQTGLVGAAMRIPVVGFLIQQGLIAYAVGSTASNKVLCTEQKAKNLGHIGVQGSMGIGGAVAGQILIPIPVLGAVIGGTIGGVAMGFYQKLVVQKNKPSIREMLEKLSSQMTPDGIIKYDESVLKVMKISKQHFAKNKPDSMDDSLWLTVLTTFLVNEIYSVSKNQRAESEKSLKEFLEKNPKKQQQYEKEMKALEKEEEEMEIVNVKWERCRIFLMNIKVLPVADRIGQFVTGMLQNFKL